MNPMLTMQFKTGSRINPLDLIFFPQNLVSSLGLKVASVA